MNDHRTTHRRWTVNQQAAGRRLDAWLAEIWPHISRSGWQKLIDDKRVLLDGQACRCSHKLRGGERVSAQLPAKTSSSGPSPEPRLLDVLFADEDMVALNKPAGMVVHPAPGHAGNTMVNALLHYFPEMAEMGGNRPGIVHRLDKDTSGAMIIARHEKARQALARQFRDRKVGKIYLAMVWGVPEPPVDTIETPIGRSSRNRLLMSATPEKGKQAVTHIKVVESFDRAALLRINIKTGRTHQIRVHMRHIGHPIIGDRQYGRGRGDVSPSPAQRQMLHSESISLEHPGNGLAICFEAPPPEDMRRLLQAFRNENRSEGSET